MTVISIVGHSGSGKTTLMEKLIRELSSRGVKVAMIKYAHRVWVSPGCSVQSIALASDVL
jgi:molybdopterin-guanine dinucleotide biosynthesis protein MobB